MLFLYLGVPEVCFYQEWYLFTWILKLSELMSWLAYGYLRPPNLAYIYILHLCVLYIPFYISLSFSLVCSLLLLLLLLYHGIVDHRERVNPPYIIPYINRKVLNTYY